MPSQRQLRVGELIRHALADMLARAEVHDPVIENHLITIPEVRMTADLRLATVHVIPLGGRDTDDVLALAERIGDPEVLSCAYDAYGARLLPQNRYAELYDVSRRRVELVRGLTNANELGDAYAMVAWGGVYMGQYRQANEAASAGMDASRNVTPGNYLHCLSWRVWARFMTGDWDGALEDQAELERAVVDDPRGLPPGPYLRAYAVASFCSELRGDSSGAERRLEEVERYLATKPRLGLVGGVGYAARTLTHQGRPEDARQLFSGAFDEVADATNVLLEAFTDVAAAAHDHRDARRIIEQARERTAVGGLLGLPLFVDRLRGRLAAADGDRDKAARLLRRSAQGFAELEAPWEEAWSRLLLAELTNDAAEAARALPVFERLGSVRELEQARLLLGAASREA
jgi:hypothetical protein